jgi:hypothetical protein
MDPFQQPGGQHGQQTDREWDAIELAAALAAEKRRPGALAAMNEGRAQHNLPALRPPEVPDAKGPQRAGSDLEALRARMVFASPTRPEQPEDVLTHGCNIYT